ncbi:MAG: FAD-binding oxidoreductase [Candidatus Gottesmanbacteria bacterium]|nr:FAD-binding oxidoreductase [Candidatus Gottesmanbacteria bacterium]
MSLPKPKKYSARLASIEKISSKVYIERFELLEPKEITFLSGQTVMLYVAPGVNRAMSIASPPFEKTSITLVHDVSPMGVYSKWALSAKAGALMELMGPLGNFVAYKESPRRKVFVATGTGIAPFHSMILDGIPSSGVSLYWGLRHEEDIFWQKEFEELSSSYPNFRFVLTLSQSSDSWVGKRGHVQDHIFSQKNLREYEYYICGNKEMVSDMREKLKAANIPNEQVKFELFY